MRRILCLTAFSLISILGTSLTIVVSASQEETKTRPDLERSAVQESIQGELPANAVDANGVETLLATIAHGRSRSVTTRVFVGGEQITIHDVAIDIFVRHEAIFEPSSRTITVKGEIDSRPVLEELRLIDSAGVLYVIRDLYLDAGYDTERVGRSIPAPVSEPEVAAGDGNSPKDAEIEPSITIQAVAAPYVQSIAGDTISAAGVTNGLVSMDCGQAYNGGRAVNDNSDTYAWYINGGNFGSTTGSVTLAGIPCRIVSWSSTRIVVYPSVPYYWGPICALLTVRVSSGGSTIYGVSVVPAIRSRIFGQCTHHVALSRINMGRQPSPTAYGGYSAITTSYEPRVGDQMQWQGRHTAIITAVNAYYSGGWRRYNVQISERNADCHNGLNVYWDYFEVGVVNGQTRVTHYIQSSVRSFGSCTLYYR